MKCQNCNNTKSFTLVKEIAYWNYKEGKTGEPFIEGDEYYVCDICGVTDVDTEEG